MSVKDIASDLKVMLLSIVAVVADGILNSPSVDGRNYELGLMFNFACLSFTDGVHTVSLEESDNDSDWDAVPANKLIGTPPVITAANVAGDTLSKLGVFSNLRYVRVVVTSTGVTTGAVIVVTDVQKGEAMPV